MDDANNSHEFFNMEKGHYGVADDKKLSDLHGDKKLVNVLLLRTEQQDQRLEQLEQRTKGYQSHLDVLEESLLEADIL